MDCDEVRRAREIAKQVRDMAEEPCSCGRCGQAAIGAKNGHCPFCDLHGVLWRRGKLMRTFTAKQVIAKWGGVRGPAR